MEALEVAKRQGKTRFIGVTTHRLPQTVDGILKTGKMDVVLAAYNFSMDGGVESAAARLQQAGIGLVLMKALAGGRSPAHWPDAGTGRRLLERPEVAGAALRWAFQKTLFASMLVGMIRTPNLRLDAPHSAVTALAQERKRRAARRARQARR